MSGAGARSFPARFPSRSFKEYIARVQFDTDYYYTAYPHATANDVKSAHIVQSSLDQLESGGRAVQPAAVCRRLSSLRAACPVPPRRNRRSSHRRIEKPSMPNQSGSVYGLTILSPIIDDHKATPSHDLQIRDYLAKLSTAGRQPFRPGARHASRPTGCHGRRDLRWHAGL